MRARAGCLTAAWALLLTATLAAARGRPDRSMPPDEDRFLGVRLPDIALTTSTGMRTDLHRIAGGRPLLFALVFTRCAGVCSPFLASWRAAEQRVSRQDVRRLVLSFDPRDSAADMAAVAHHLGADADADWTFAIADPDDIRRLAAAIGFWYDWDTSRQQFDHPAMLAAVRDDHLVRLMIAGTVTPARLDEMVREASGEFVASYPLPGRARFRCFQYDAATGRRSLDWGFALLLVPAATVGLTTGITFAFGTRVRRGGSR